MEDEPSELLAALIGDRPAGEVSLSDRGGVAHLLVRNEFATVWIRLDRSANGVRLVVTDGEAGTEIALDPLELEAISRMRHDDFDERILERGTPAADDDPALDPDHPTRP